MKQLFIFSLIIVVLASCKPVNVDKELAQIDSLTTIIKNNEIELDEIDIDKVKALQEQMSNQIMLLKSIYGDSIEWETAKMLTNYYNANKAFRKYIDKHSFVKDELTYSYNQLSDLKAVLTNNIISTDTFHIYFEKECKAAQELEGLIQKEMHKARSSLETYKEHLPKVQELLAEQNTEEGV
jgi:hypothetical protein